MEPAVDVVVQLPFGWRASHSDVTGPQKRSRIVGRHERPVVDPVRRVRTAIANGVDGQRQPGRRARRRAHGRRWRWTPGRRRSWRHLWRGSRLRRRRHLGCRRHQGRRGRLGRWRWGGRRGRLGRHRWRRRRAGVDPVVVQDVEVDVAPGRRRLDGRPLAPLVERRDELPLSVRGDHRSHAGRVAGRVPDEPRSGLGILVEPRAHRVAVRKLSRVGLVRAVLVPTIGLARAALVPAKHLHVQVEAARVDPRPLSDLGAGRTDGVEDEQDRLPTDVQPRLVESIPRVEEREVGVDLSVRLGTLASRLVVGGPLEGRPGRVGQEVHELVVGGRSLAPPT